MIGLIFVAVFNLAMLANCALFLWLRWSGRLNANNSHHQSYTWNYSVYTRLILPAQLLLLLASFLVGCGGIVESAIDPAGYTQRTQAQADAQRAQADAQRAFAESQSALAQSEAQRAQADAHAAQSKADADKATAAAFAKLGDAIKEAGKPNNTPIVVAMLLIAIVAGWAVWNASRTSAAIATARHMLAPPPSVQLIAEQQGLRPVHDGQRWLLVDENGTIVQRQKLLA